MYIHGGRRSVSLSTGLLQGTSLDVLDVRTMSVMAVETQQQQQLLQSAGSGLLRSSTAPQANGTVPGAGLQGVPIARAGHNMLLWGSSLVVFGGLTDAAGAGGGGEGSGGLLNDVVLLDRGTLQWSSLAPFAGGARGKGQSLRATD